MNTLVSHEGFCNGPSIDVNTLTPDTLIQINLRMNRIHGQCYDGASNMAGAKKGVAEQILNIEDVLCLHNVVATH